MDTGLAVGLRLAVILALIAANGFFAAAEYGLVTARKTRIDALAARGNPAAVALRRALEDPNRFIFACQLGITVAGLALGWVAEATIVALIEPLLVFVVPQGFAGLSAHAIAIPVAFASITFLLMSLGEQVPKMFAIQKAELTALAAVGPVSVVGFVFYPFIALLSGFTTAVLRLFGLQWRVEKHQAYSMEDLKSLIRASRGGNALTEDPGSLAERALDFSALLARHVMVPRTEMVAAPVDITPARLRELLRRHEHSRYPVFEGTRDNIVGVMSAKHLVAVLPGADSTEGFDLRSQMSAPVFIPEMMAAHRVLAALKLHRTHLAIVVDEYGATAGIVTLRDLLDRIAGEVRDETEEAEPPRVQRLPDGSAIIDGLALLSDVQEEFRIKLSGTDYDTLGGFVFGRLGRRPAVGDAVEVAGYRFTIEEVDGLRVSRVRVNHAKGEALAD